MNDLLKFITCGSVDDGKSTLIGHMLYDAKLLFADQKEALIKDSRTGARGGEIDYSLLLDGLMAEREQGITIDVAYRYFTTEKRSFIVADTPGHEEYTRNMAVGASFAELAVILIDAAKGVLTQTKRHVRICSLMGIRYYVFAVNKMDLVDFDQRVWKKILKQIRILMAEFDDTSMMAIPVSATDGDNITKPSKRTAWYQGPTLLDCLETVEISNPRTSRIFTMPVQRVCRPNHTFRGFQGQISTGNISLGDQICILPSMEKAGVKTLMKGFCEVSSACEQEAVTICLDREIDVARGDVLVSDSVESPVYIGQFFRVKLLWMDENRLLEGKNYLMKLGTLRIPVTVMKIQARVDVNTGNEIRAEAIYKNEIAVCDLSTANRIAASSFEDIPDLGSFILIDRLSHMTSACGTISHKLTRSDNLTWHQMDISRSQRASQKGQEPKTIWLTGLSGSGKSTLANELEKHLFLQGRHTMTLDGDNLRLGLNSNLGFRESERIENIRRVAEVAKLMNDAGLIVIVSLVSPFTRDRRRAREIIGKENFIEVYVSTPLKECERRDVKGLYKRARMKEIPDFTGISSPYEPPRYPDVTIDTSAYPPREAAEKLIGQLGDLL